MKKAILAMLLACAMLLTLAAPVSNAASGPNLVEVAISVNSSGPFAGQFDTLIAAVLAADPAVLKALTSPAKLTVFAPTDDAFDELGLNENNIGTLDQKVLTDILLYHVARGELKSGDVVAREKIRTVYGDFLKVDGTVLKDNLGRESNIIVTDVMAGNGVIHAIDAVVLPYDPANPPVADTLLEAALKVNAEGPFAGQFDTLIAAVLAADRSVQVRLSGLYRTTVFAPTDGAFEELGLNESNIASLGETALTEILRYHMTDRRMFSFDVVERESLRMLWGGQVRVEGTTLTDNLGRASSIIVTDVQSRNGIIHAISRVLLPYDPAMPPVMNLVDTAISLNSQGTYAGQFDTLIAALLAADPAVLQALSGPSRRTVFAPTDSAFAALGLNPGNVGTLGEEALTDILLYHVAQGKRFSTEVVSQNVITTLSGKLLMVDGATLIDRVGRPANIIVTDIQASNGIIHAIDSVLLPGA